MKSIKLHTRSRGVCLQETNSIFSKKPCSADIYLARRIPKVPCVFIILFELLSLIKFPSHPVPHLVTLGDFKEGIGSVQLHRGEEKVLDLSIYWGSWTVRTVLAANNGKPSSAGLGQS